MENSSVYWCCIAYYFKGAGSAKMAVDAKWRITCVNSLIVTNDFLKINWHFSTIIFFSPMEVLNRIQNFFFYVYQETQIQ